MSSIVNAAVAIVAGVTAGAIGAAVLFAGFLRGLWVLPRIWRDDWEWAWDRSPTPAAWPYGDELWRGFARIPPVALGMAGSLPITFVLLNVKGDSAALLILYYIFIGVWIASFVLLLTVVLLNRPKWVVAPHLRQQPGAVVAWWRHLRGRGTTDASGS